MLLGEFLVVAKLVTSDEINQALRLQQERGGRLGDNLIALLPEKAKALRAFLERMPDEPKNVYDVGIHPSELLTLLLKQICALRLETPPQFADKIKLPPHIVEELVQMGIARNLLAAMGTMHNTMRYELSEQGRRWAQEALKNSQYLGPAPVTLEQFCARVKLQKVNSDAITFEQIRAALAGYEVTDDFINRIGPALNAGRSLLMYGPPGNGKTSVALSFANVFSTIIYMPHAVVIEGQIMRVFDPSLHAPLTPEPDQHDSAFTSLRREAFDARWVPMRRPFVVTGGELTLEMLDLNFDHASGFYEAPLHIKALGGCFVIDDFGRQIVPPAVLLNRWIVPMESHVDYLKLHTGKSFSIPFEALVIFSTNLNPQELMDAAFLRRLPYKIEIGAPSRQTYRSIFEKVCAKAELEFNDTIFEIILHKVTQEKRLELAAFHARFIIDQVLAISRFLGRPPRVDLFAIDYALNNLAVNSQK